MALAVTDLRTIVRNTARNALSSGMYTDTVIDYSLQYAGNYWQRVVKSSRSLGTSSTFVGSNTISAPASWLPIYHMQAALTLSGQTILPFLQVITYEEILIQQASYGIPVSNSPVPIPQTQPRYVGFADNNTTGTFDVLADKVYTVNWWYWQPFTSWVAGGTSSAFNATDAELLVIAKIGAAAQLQIAEPENAERCKAMWADFEKEAQRFHSLNIGGRDGNVSIRDNSWDKCGVNPNWIPRG